MLHEGLKDGQSALARWAQQKLQQLQPPPPAARVDVVSASERARARARALDIRLAQEARTAWLEQLYGVVRADPSTWDHPDLPRWRRQRGASPRAGLIAKGALCEDDSQAMHDIERAFRLITARVDARASRFERVDGGGADHCWSDMQVDAVDFYLAWARLCAGVPIDLRPVILLAVEDLGLRAIERQLRLRNGSAMASIRDALDEWHVRKMRDRRA